MVIQNAIVHEVVKEQGTKTTTTKIRKTVLPVTDQVTELVAKVRTLYSERTGRSYGDFDEDAAFADDLTALQANTIEFQEWSVRSMAALERELRATPAATGGHMFFTRYAEGGHTYLFIAMLKHTAGISFSDDLDILDVNHLDLEKLHLAARIDIDTWQTPDSHRYVSFVKGKANREIRDYFLRYLAVTEPDDSSRQTGLFVDAIRDYCAELNDDEANSVTSKVLEFCRSQAANNEPIEMQAVANVVSPDDPNEFLAFIGQDGMTVPSDFLVDVQKLKRLEKYSGGRKGLAITFDTDLFNREVFYNHGQDGGPDELVIRPAPANLVAQLPRTDN